MWQLYLAVIIYRGTSYARKPRKGRPGWWEARVGRQWVGAIIKDRGQAGQGRTLNILALTWPGNAAHTAADNIKKAINAFTFHALKKTK